MGAWNTGVFFNDITCDIRDTYIHFLKQQYTDDDAYQKTVEEYSELLGTDEEALFWYSLADIQWDAGRLVPSVKNTALKFIEEKGGLELYTESEKTMHKWEIALQRLKDKLEAPIPPRKKYRKSSEFVRNPWNIGDVYAYQFHTDKAAESGLYGQYILFQKVGDVEYYKGVTCSIIQVFDKAFETIPSIDTIKSVRALPLVFPAEHSDSLHSDDNYIPSFNHYLKATMIYEKKRHYPKEYLIFVGNQAIPAINCSDSRQFTNFFWENDGMDEWLVAYYNAWQGVDY